MKPRFKVEILKKTEFSLSTARVKKLVGILFQELKGNKILKKARKAQVQVQLSLVFVGIAESEKLNSRYRKKHYATDVLSFEGSLQTMDDFFLTKELSLGELVFCVPVLKRQAREHGLKLQEEFEYLLIHGFLHLLGFDHEKSKTDEKRMTSLQDKLFEKYC